MFGGAAHAAPARRRNVSTTLSTTVAPFRPHEHAGTWPVLLRGPAAVYGARARAERVRPCATHVHRSKLLFEMELDEIRGIPVHEHAMRRSWPDAPTVVFILEVGGAHQPSRVLERHALRSCCVSVTTCEDT